MDLYTTILLTAFVSSIVTTILNRWFYHSWPHLAPKVKAVPPKPPAQGLLRADIDREIKKNKQTETNENASSSVSFDQSLLSAPESMVPVASEAPAADAPRVPPKTMQLDPDRQRVPVSRNDQLSVHRAQEQHRLDEADTMEKVASPVELVKLGELSPQSVLFRSVKTQQFEHPEEEVTSQSPDQSRRAPKLTQAEINLPGEDTDATQEKFNLPRRPALTQIFDLTEIQPSQPRRPETVTQPDDLTATTDFDTNKLPARASVSHTHIDAAAPDPSVFIMTQPLASMVTDTIETEQVLDLDQPEEVTNESQTTRPQKPPATIFSLPKSTDPCSNHAKNSHALAKKTKTPADLSGVVTCISCGWGKTRNT